MSFVVTFKLTGPKLFNKLSSLFAIGALSNFTSPKLIELCLFEPTILRPILKAATFTLVKLTVTIYGVSVNLIGSTELEGP